MCFTFYKNLMFYLFFLFRNISESSCRSCMNENKNKSTVHLNTLLYGMGNDNLNNNKKNNSKINYIDINKYKNKLKYVLDEISKIEEYNRIFIQSDTEGKKFNILSMLQIAGIIDINKPITVYYNIYTGNFNESSINEDDIEVKFFEVNKNFKGTYIHLGDIVDRCNGEDGCIYSLLYLLYVKKILSDKIKLICGNHELNYYDIQDECMCCRYKKNVILKIIFRAISEGEIKYFDSIEIGGIKYILTHKVVSSLDIGKIKSFIKDNVTDKIDLGKFDFYGLMEYVNNIFKNKFREYIERNKDNFEKLETYDLISFSKDYDQASNGFIVNSYRSTDLDFIKSYKGYFLSNQICGHDHHYIYNCYIPTSNILYVDNYSSDVNNNPMVNIHFFDKNQELNKHKGFVFIKEIDDSDIKVGLFNKFN